MRQCEGNPETMQQLGGINIYTVFAVPVPDNARNKAFASEFATAHKLCSFTITREKGEKGSLSGTASLRGGGVYLDTLQRSRIYRLREKKYRTVISYGTHQKLR